LQPDNNVQEPYNTQNYNRYGYCLNNPLKYTDPSGEIFGLDDLAAAIVIGAIISATTYTLMAITGHVPFTVGGFIQATFIGALSGAITFGVSSAVSSVCGFSNTAVGFWSGAAQGATTGFFTGITSSVINTVVSGGSIKLGSLLKDGLIGAGIGGLIGGISGAVQNKRDMKNIRSGCEKMGINEGHPVPATDDFLNKSQKTWFPDAPMEKTLNFTVENVPKNTFTGELKNKLAVTYAQSYNKILSGCSTVYFNSDTAFTSAKTLYYAMGHEFVHVSQYAALIGYNVNQFTPEFQEMLEFHAYSYQHALGDPFVGTSFTPDVVRKFASFGDDFSRLNYNKFSWTSNTNFR
jgi:hypothetical protein